MNQLRKSVFCILFNELRDWTDLIICYLPGNVGLLVRRFYFSRACKDSRSTYIAPGTKIQGSENILLENHVSLGLNNYLNAVGGSISIAARTAFNHNVQLNASIGGRIVIGSDCLIGPNVFFRTASHRYLDRKILIRHQGHKVGDIVVGDDVWIGAGAVLLGGITIGSGAVIGAGAVVTKDIPEYSIAVGVPAAVVGTRF